VLLVENSDVISTCWVWQCRLLLLLVFAAFEVGWLFLLLIFVVFGGDLVGCLPPFFMVVDVLALLDLVPRGEVGVFTLHTLPLVFFEVA